MSEKGASHLHCKINDTHISIEEVSFNKCIVTFLDYGNHQVEVQTNRPETIRNLIEDCFKFAGKQENMKL